MPPSPNKNAGVQVREKVLEAIAPLRRGRPTPISLHRATTGPSSPMQEKVECKSTELDFNDAEDESWKADCGAVRAYRSGLVSPTKWPLPVASYDDAWSVARGPSTDAEKAKNRDRRKTIQGSQVDLSGFGDSFGVGWSYHQLRSNPPPHVWYPLVDTAAEHQASGDY
jgi:AP2-associated kinase